MLRSKFHVYILCFLGILLFTPPELYSQSNSIKFQYAPLKRKKISGKHSLILPSQFAFLNVFNSDQRFAPDEPSSFLSIEYFFKERPINKNLKLNWSLGLFRNHIKGDIILDESIIHFGRGNSHFGISSSLNIYTHLCNTDFQLAILNQLGVGPLVTRFESNELAIIPDDWKINGSGIIYNCLLEIKSPLLFNRLSIHLGTLFNITHTTLNDLDLINNQNQTKRYSKLNFTTISKLPSINIGFSYSLLNPKNNE